MPDKAIEIVNTHKARISWQDKASAVGKSKHVIHLLPNTHRRDTRRQRRQARKHFSTKVSIHPITQV